MNDFLDGKLCGHEFTDRGRVAMQICPACLVDTVSRLKQALENYRAVMENSSTARALEDAQTNLQAFAREVERQKIELVEARLTIVALRAERDEAKATLAKDQQDHEHAVEALFGAGRAAVTTPDGRFEKVPYEYIAEVEPGTDGGPDKSGAW